MSKGIDVSYAQGNINWPQVKKAGIEFVIVRDGYSTNHTDTKFIDNVTGAKAAGIIVEGIYHFSYAATIDEARREAEFAVSLAKKVGLPKSTVIFYDFEYDTVASAKRRNVTLTPKECNSFTDAFCKTVSAAGYVPGIYLNTDFYNNWYNKSMLNAIPTIWFAKWSKDKPAPRHKYWQYSANGRVNGISVVVDLDEKVEEVKMEETKPKLKPLKEVAMDVIAGKYGNGEDRKKNLESAGYNYREVQAEVNRILSDV